MNMKEKMNMKKLSILLASGFIGMSGLMTSCSEDYPGPDPVDVTANYSNKHLSHANLVLNYSGEELFGKSIDFSTVKGENANITLYDILPGEAVVSLTNVPLSGTTNEYTFSGDAAGANTNIQFHYDGKVEKGHLIFNLTDIQTAGSTQWAENYLLSEITKSSNETIGAEVPVTGAGFVDTKMALILITMYFYEVH